MAARPANIGIKAIELYFPSQASRPQKLRHPPHLAKPSLTLSSVR